MNLICFDYPKAWKTEECPHPGVASVLSPPVHVHSEVQYGTVSADRVFVDVVSYDEVPLEYGEPQIQ